MLVMPDGHCCRVVESYIKVIGLRDLYWHTIFRIPSGDASLLAYSFLVIPLSEIIFHINLTLLFY